MGWGTVDFLAPASFSLQKFCSAFRSLGRSSGRTFSYTVAARPRYCSGNIFKSVFMTVPSLPPFVSDFSSRATNGVTGEEADAYIKKIKEALTKPITAKAIKNQKKRRVS